MADSNVYRILTGLEGINCHYLKITLLFDEIINELLESYEPRVE
jgi:hypothetical protein